MRPSLFGPIEGSALLVGLLLVAPAARAQGASFQGLGDLPGGGFASQAYGVSADGQAVVGTGFSGRGIEAFRWTVGGGMQGIDDLPGGSFESEGTGVSGDGDVVVGLGTNAGDDEEAFRWTPAGGVQGLGTLGGTQGSQARGASADGGVVVGFSDAPFVVNEAFRWTAATGMVGLGFLPDAFDSGANDVSDDGSVVVGWAEDADRDYNRPVRWAGGIQVLGDLPGGTDEGEAWAVSADGSVVVGVSRAASGDVAFRWTEATGMVGLGFLTGDLASRAYGVSADGGVVVGESVGAGTRRAFIWTEAEGMRDLFAVLETDYGLVLTGWRHTPAYGVSADGSVVVGFGFNPQGQLEAWRAVVPRLRLLDPTADALVVGGERTLVRWSAPADLPLVDLYLLPDTLGAEAVEVAAGLLATDGAYSWVAPADLFSRSARLLLRGTIDDAVADTSGYFRLKPYHLTRLTEGGARYDPFRPDRNGWPFNNIRNDLFPPEWYGLPPFNYAVGPDPFTQGEYDGDFTAPPINGAVGVFADWPAYVRAFGTDAAYHLIVPFVEAFYRDSFTAAWGAFHAGKQWGGSCSGMSISSLLAFGHRDAFGARYPEIGPVEQLFAVGMSVPVREMVNTLYAYWPGLTQRQHRQAIGRDTRTPRQTLADLKAMFLSESRASDGYLYISSGTVGGGAHAVVPYGLRRDPDVPGWLRVLVYDPNRRADATASVLIDSLANRWSYGGGLGWGGATGMYLMDPATNYLALAVASGAVPFDAVPAAGPGGPPPLYVAVPPGADAALASAGGTVGYAAGAVFNTIPGASADFPPVGGATPPVGFEVPPGPYALTLGAFPQGAASAYFFTPGGGPIYAYGRADADSSQTDRVVYDPGSGLGGLTARSDDAGSTKRVALRAVLPGATSERTLDAADLSLVGADSVRFSVLDGPAGPRLRMENPGGAKSYTVRLRQAGMDGGVRFRHAAVPLPAGAAHTVRPDWAALEAGPVEVDVDLDGDGDTDETLVLANQPVAVDPADSGPPSALALHGPSPNPAAGGAVTLRFDLPAAGPVRLVVYDVLGREVAVLADGERAVGTHEVTLDVGRLAPGVYVVRLTAGEVSVVHRVTVAR